MKFTYIRDISEKSVDRIHTPAYSFLWLPLLLYNCGHAWSYRNFYIEREGLNNYFMLYTHSGSGKLRYNGKELILTAGTIVIFHCLNYQWYGTVSDDEPWEYHYMHFSGSIAEKLYSLLGGNRVSPITIGNNTRIINVWEKIGSNIGSNNSMIDMLNCSLLMQIITEIMAYKNVTNTEINHPYAQELEKAINTIEQNYNTKLHLEDMLQEIHVSKYYFIKLFKQYKGISPYEYLIRFRINQAKKLLLQSDMNVYEIALQVGFDDSNSFIRCFKKYTNSTPLKYRNSGGEGLYMPPSIHEEG